MRLRYTATLSALISMVLVATLTPLGYLYARNARLEATGRLTDTAASVAPAVSVALDDDRPGALDRALRRLSTRHDLELSVRTPDGAVTSSARESTALPRAFQRGGGWVGSGPLVPAAGSSLSVRLPLPSGDRGEAATLLVRQPGDEVRQRVLTVWSLLALFLPFGLACCLLPALALRRRTLRTARRLGDVLRSVSRSAHNARAEAPYSRCDLRELDAEVDRLATTVRSAMEERQAFLADVAHQLRNPLTALRLRIENLDAYLPASAAVRRTRLLADVDRLDRTLTAMVDQARGELVDDHATQIVDVCRIVAECLRGWAVVTERRALQLRFHGPRRAWAVARPGAVEQALDVALDNAVKHAPQGSVIRLQVTVSGPSVRIEVQDEGPGLPPTDHRRAVERGWRRGPGPGHGLGLAIAAKLLTSAGGDIELRPHETSGLSAVLHLVNALPGGSASVPEPTELATAPSEWG